MIPAKITRDGYPRQFAGVAPKSAGINARQEQAGHFTSTNIYGTGIPAGINTRAGIRCLCGARNGSQTALLQRALCSSAMFQHVVVVVSFTQILILQRSYETGARANLRASPRCLQALMPAKSRQGILHPRIYMAPVYPRA
jgi:hypothetical protein